MDLFITTKQLDIQQEAEQYKYWWNFTNIYTPKHNERVRKAEEKRAALDSLWEKVIAEIYG